MLKFNEPLPKIKTFWYVATPYSKHPKGTEVAFEEACKVAAELIKEKIPIFCPIAHTHSIAEFGGVYMPSGDLKFWLPVDQPLIDAAEGLIVAKLESWDTSEGVKYEIDDFIFRHKPIRYLDWPSG